ncbi:unnamed protein product [Effrenium voratum]|uniref:Transcription and mRNA export factor ENY2 n=1 Tax=Effrenium voratum TaxID=2562239 RepID=A0AA36J457_9DINO|nr:unnamed protein product [Effrenium voratum]
MEQSMLDVKLQETGERERLKEYIIGHLNECGWREDLKKQCVDFIQNKGVEQVSLEEMIADIAPRGRATLPEKLKVEVFNRLRQETGKTGTRVDSLIWVSGFTRSKRSRFSSLNGPSSTPRHEMESWLAEAEIYCHRLNRSRTAWSLERTGHWKQQLRALRRRNEQLASTVKILDEALSSCKSRSAKSLSLFRGTGPVACSPQETESEDWRSLALRIPSVRKSWSEAKAYHALHKAGLPEHLSLKEIHRNEIHPESPEGFHFGAMRDREPWEVVATLISHPNAVRNARICQGVLFTAGDDATVKAVDLSGFRRNSEAPCDDWEPFTVYRAHTGPVLALALPEDAPPVGFSGGMDGDIYSFEVMLPSECPSEMSHLQRFRGHRDSVWALDLQPKLGLLASTGADKMVLLWQAAQDGCVAAPLQALDLPSDGFGPVTGIAWGPRSSSLLLCCGSWASSCCAMDAEQGVAAYRANAKTREDHAAPVLAVACHRSSDIAVSGHADACARVFSPLTGRSMWTLQCGQGKMVTSVALDPGPGTEVVAAGHDGSLHIFDLRTCRCVQEAHLHERAIAAQGEAIHSVHHSGDFIVTAGADATVHLLERTKM